MKLFTCAHLAGSDCFVEGHAVVFLVFLCIPTNHTHELSVVATEELEFLTVQIAHLLRRGVGPLDLLLPHCVGQVPQCQITRGLRHRKQFLTDGTRLQAALCPPLLNTVLTEAVAAQQDDGIVKYVAAHGTSEVHF